MLTLLLLSNKLSALSCSFFPRWLIYKVAGKSQCASFGFS